ncbi:MAG: hypothetical protein HON47_02175 [Candidatus Diapherotrites archaeon]|uniref:Uncharacterized protein n=1 Tax=Candidatus Iainarchaeum sp. TaxID=3101447 RepID=A0A8T5GEA7_9ARCH|nr:hypothetical protein [Candidatus Diapherotrites archaeon]MBT7241443.1 hypothetical protein [Candidatus Diapherotrites archaeon]
MEKDLIIMIIMPKRPDLPKTRSPRGHKVPDPEKFQRHLGKVKSLVPKANLMHAKRILTRRGMNAHDYSQVIRTIVDAVRVEKGTHGGARSAKVVAGQILRPLLHHELEAVQKNAAKAIKQIRKI